jgi:hypothetical protein
MMFRENWRRGLVLSLATVAGVAGSLSPANAQFADRLVQAPHLTPPERGSVRGTLSGVAFTAADLSRGSFQLPLPVAVPTERGPLQAKVLPAYSPDNGLSEWGMGWNVDLGIRRHRLLGEVDFNDDGFMSPWGQLQAGTDGYYYPKGLSAPVRLQKVARPLVAEAQEVAADLLSLAFVGSTLPAQVTSEDWLATEFDGTQYRFSASAGVRTERGAYSWLLTEVVSLVGDRTTLTWKNNSSGRPYLSRVSWGARGGPPQYELRLEYEAVPTALVEHSVGIPLSLDQRVRVITVSALESRTGTFAERWHYTLGYRSAPFGPAFYLETVQRFFASGESQPAMVYSYELDATRLPQAPLQRYTGLDAVLHNFGDTVLQPDRGALHDVDADGRIDLEVASDLTLAKHTDAGWVSTPLPPASGIDDRCRPWSYESNRPRTLARLTAENPTRCSRRLCRLSRWCPRCSLVIASAAQWLTSRFQMIGPLGRIHGWWTLIEIGDLTSCALHPGGLTFCATKAMRKGFASRRSRTFRGSLTLRPMLVG